MRQAYLGALGDLDDTVDSVAHEADGAIGVWLTGIEPGGDGGDGDCGYELRGPGRSCRVGDLRGEVFVRDQGHIGAELVHGLAEFRFACGVVEQKVEPGGIGSGGA